MTTFAVGEPIRSMAPRARSGSAGSLMSKRRYLKLVLPRLATRTFTRPTLLRTCSTTAWSGRGMTWAALSSPTRAAASAPASTAARTLLTSPRTITLTMPPSSLITELASSTLAALSIASTAVINPTRPSVSIRPRAFPFIFLAPAVDGGMGICLDR